MLKKLHKNTGIGSYCGDLSTPVHVLDQVLQITKQTGAEATPLEQVPPECVIEEIPILFTSLYSWYEFSCIADQREAIRKWDQKILKIGGAYHRLNLLHYNIPFNVLNRYPTPAELKAVMQDMNDEAWIALTASFWRHLHLDLGPFTEIAQRVDSLRSLGDKNFVERETTLLEEIDAFREIKPKLVEQLDSLATTPLIVALKALYGKKLTGIDKLLYLDYAVKHMGFFHNKNSKDRPERTTAASAADKAQHDFQQLEKKPFLPESATKEDKELFKTLYSMYWTQEEGNVHKNPEIRRYLSSENIKGNGRADSKRLEAKK